MHQEEFKNKKEEFIFYVEKAKQFLGIDQKKSEFYLNKASELKKQIDEQEEKGKNKETSVK